MDYWRLLILFGIGSLAGFINVNAGGGSSLTLPALIFLGLDSALANGTNRLGILIQNIFAVTSFRKNKVHQFQRSFQYALFTLPGAVVGALIAVRVTNILFQRILGGVLIFIVFSIFFSGSYKNKQFVEDYRLRWLIYPALFAIGFYGGFIQAGVGFLLIGSLYHLLKLDLILVNMHKVFIISIYTIPALIIFILTGNVNWTFGLALAAGTSFGAWWGVQAAIKGGEKVIRIILATAVVIMAFKLFGMY